MKINKTSTWPTLGCETWIKILFKYLSHDQDSLNEIIILFKHLSGVEPIMLEQVSS